MGTVTVAVVVPQVFCAVRVKEALWPSVILTDPDAWLMLCPSEGFAGTPAPGLICTKVAPSANQFNCTGPGAARVEGIAEKETTEGAEQVVWG